MNYSIYSVFILLLVHVLSFFIYMLQKLIYQHGGIFGVPDEGEDIQLHLFDYAEITMLFKNNRLKNAPVIMALQWLSQHIQRQ
jgi:ADP-ribose pyrophosphatase